MSPWVFAEPCCGSAAISLALLGARRALLPYQGSKWRYRKPILALFEELGFNGLPATIWLSDSPDSPWNTTWKALAEDHEEVARNIRSFLGEDPLVLYNSLHGRKPTSDRGWFAAEHLVLQRLAFSGKAVSLTPATQSWYSPGFNETSAYGKESTASFGAVRPMLPYLYDTVLRLPRGMGRIRIGAPFPLSTQRCLVYIDPPYVRGTKYQEKLSREEVIAMALRYKERGWSVVISEGEPIEELGWKTRRIVGPDHSGGSPFRGKNEEWLTWKR